jgi:hypothetical protein
MCQGRKIICCCGLIRLDFSGQTYYRATDKSRALPLPEARRENFFWRSFLVVPNMAQGKGHSGADNKKPVMGHNLSR